MGIKCLKGIILLVFLVLFFRWIYSPDPRIEKFFEAVERGDAAAVGEMLDEARGLALAARGIRDREPDVIMIGGETPLHVAVASAGQDDSHYKICRLLIGRGADVNALKIIKTEESVFHVTPLLELFMTGGAATKTRLNILELLLAEGADAGRRDKGGHTALGMAKGMRDEGLNEKAVEIFKRHGVFE